MARRVFPTREEATFVVADDIRVEQSSKILVVGFYAGNRIVVFKTPTAEQPTKLRLAFLLAFRDGVGDFQPKLAISAPDGSALFKHDFDLLTKEPESALVIAAAGVLEMKELGEYHVTLSLSERDYAFAYTLQEAKGQRGAPRRRTRREGRK